MKLEKYTMSLLCAVEHLENVINGQVPLGERNEVIGAIISHLAKVSQSSANIPSFMYGKEG